MSGSVWLIKLLLAHLLTDFVLQPGSWIRDRPAEKNTVFPDRAIDRAMEQED
jgi:hypothetical protein